MKRWVVWSAMLACVLGAVAPASAKIMRFQHQGPTALVYHIPDDWTFNTDIENGSETLEGPGKGGGLISLAVIERAGSLEDTGTFIIQQAGGSPVAPQRTMTVSTKKAVLYVEHGISGGSLDLRLLVIQADATHIAMVLELTSPRSTPAQVAAADAVLDSVRVSPPDTQFGS